MDSLYDPKAQIPQSDPDPPNQSQAHSAPQHSSADLIDARLRCLRRFCIGLAYLYLIYQVVLVVCLTVYYYYQLDMYFPLAFFVTIAICYLRSQTAFISLRLSERSSKNWATKNWKELRDWFYWSIALMIIGVVILMGIIPLRISQLVNINLMNLLIINGVDFIVFTAMGIISIRFCHLIIKNEAQ